MKVQYDDGQIGYPQKRNVMREGEPNANQETTSETAARPAGAARTDDAAVAPEHRPPGALGAEFAPQTAAQTAPATDDLADFRAYFTQHPEDLATVADQTRAEHRADHAAIADQVNLDAVHRLAVQMALEQGLPMRPDVLADYPELAPAALNEGGPHATETRNKPENPEQQHPGGDAQLRPQGNHRDVAPEEPQGGDQAGGGDQLRPTETEPEEVGEHGPIFRQYYHDAQGAITELMQHENGEAPGALYHPEVGDIDLIWGNKGKTQRQGYGLAKLIAYHQEVLSNLQQLIESMSVTERTDNTIQLESSTHHAVVRLNWKGNEKQWLLTAFEMPSSPAAESRIDFSSKPETGQVGRQTTLPTGEANPIIPQTATPGAGEVGTVGGSSVPFHYEVREAGELRTSHHWSSFAENPDYQREVPGAQRRKRDSANARTQVLRIAAEPDPARLIDSPLAQQGAPTIDAEGHVIAGNGRAMGITRGYRMNHSMGGYRQYLRDHAARFGLDPATIDGMKEPVLVRVGEFADAAHKERFADDANMQETMQLTAAEQAAADQYLLTDDVLKSLVPHPAGHINTQDNNPFIRRIIGRISPSDRGNMLNGQELSRTACGASARRWC